VTLVKKSEIPPVELFFLGEHIAKVTKDHIKIALSGIAKTTIDSRKN
jgi:hypothetical protein